MLQNRLYSGNAPPVVSRNTRPPVAANRLSTMFAQAPVFDRGFFYLRTSMEWAR